MNAVREAAVRAVLPVTDNTSRGIEIGLKEVTA